MENGTFFFLNVFTLLMFSFNNNNLLRSVYSVPTVLHARTKLHGGSQPKYGLLPPIFQNDEQMNRSVSDFMYPSW